MHKLQREQIRMRCWLKLLLMSKYANRIRCKLIHYRMNAQLRLFFCCCLAAYSRSGYSMKPQTNANNASAYTYIHTANTVNKQKNLNNEKKFVKKNKLCYTRIWLKHKRQAKQPTTLVAQRANHIF